MDVGPRQHRVVVNANSMASLEGTNRGNRDLYECKMVVRLTATGVDGVEVVVVVEEAGQGMKMRSAWVASGRKVNIGVDRGGGEGGWCVGEGREDCSYIFAKAVKNVELGAQVVCCRELWFVVWSSCADGVLLDFWFTRPG
jgi:hypothetical protein